MNQRLKEILKEQDDKWPDPDGILILKLEDLRHSVENFNKEFAAVRLRGGTYKQIDPNTVFTVSYPPWVFGYQLEECNFGMLRHVFIKCKEPLEEVPQKNRDEILFTICDVLLDQGQSMPQPEILGRFGMKISQYFIPVFLTEKNPNLVSKGPWGKRTES